MTKAKKKRMLAFSLTLLICLTAFISPVMTRAEEDNEALQMSVKMGFNGFAKINSNMPVEVNIKNDGEPIKGELQLEVLINEFRKTMYSQIVEIPKGAEKTIKMDIPLRMASKDIQVKLFNGKKLVKEETQSLIKIIDYGSTVMGVLSEDVNALNYFNGIQLGAMTEDMPQEKLKLMMAAGEIPNQGKIEMLALDSNVFPEDYEVLKAFKVLLISNYDTTLLNEKQLQALSKWVKEGNVLILGTGENWQKVYKALPDELKPLAIKDTQPVNFPQDILEDESLSDNVPKDIISVVSKTDESTVKSAIFSDESEGALVSKYYLNNGVICILSFDPAQYSFSKWVDVETFLSSLFGKIGLNQAGKSIYNDNNSNYQYNLNHLASQIPEGKQPPYLMIFITLGIYLLVVGPILYIVLKLIDKRDMSWVIIPALALLCTLVIYVAGFKTRYTTAVLNNVSVISLHENDQASINTSMAAFNNKKGKMVFEYSPELEINFQADNYYYEDRYYQNPASNPANNIEGAKLESKMTMTDPVIYELYDVFMWSPRGLNTNTQIDIKTKEFFKDIQIKNNHISGIISNKTPYDLKQAFISIGTNYIYLGDVLAGEELEFDKPLDENSEVSGWQGFLDKYYGSVRMASGQKPPKDYQEIVRKRNIMDSVINSSRNGNAIRSIYSSSPYASVQTVSVESQIATANNFNIALYAINYQSLGYDIKINGQQPESFNTNAIQMSKELSFPKGSTVQIPAGLVLPQMNMQSQIASYDYSDGTQSGIRVEQKGDIDLTAYIPKQFRVNKLEVEFGTMLPYYAKLMMMEQNTNKNAFPIEVLSNEYEYYIFNLNKAEWEKVEQVFEASSNTNEYINSNGELQLRVKVLKVAEYGNERKQYEREILSIPEIRFEGVVK